MEFFWLRVEFNLYLALFECCLNHKVPILINYDLRQFRVIHEFVDDPITHQLWCLVKAMLHNVATTFLHGQISNMTCQLIHYSGCCPMNFETKNKLNNIVPARTEIISCIMQKA